MFNLLRCVPYMGITVTVFGILILQIVARLNCKAQIWWVPYSSYIAMTSPESTIFSFTLSLAQAPEEEYFSAFMTISTTWIYFNKHNPSRWNNVAYALYTIAIIFTVLTVTCTSELTKGWISPTNRTHDVSGITLIICGVLYAIIIARIRINVCVYGKRHSASCRRRLCRMCKIHIIQVGIVLICAVSFMVSFALTSIELSRYGRMNLYNVTGFPTDWKNEDGSCKDVIQFVPKALQLYQGLAGAFQIPLLWSISTTPALCSEYFEITLNLKPKTVLHIDDVSPNTNNNETLALT